MYILSCESTVDIPFDDLRRRGVPILSYSYFIDGTRYQDLDSQNPDTREWFYGQLKEGKLPQTSQLNFADYEAFFEKQIAKGDVLHVIFGSGMTNSVQNAVAAAEAVRERHPDRRLEVVDSLCSCSGYGLLVDTALKLKEFGKTFDEVLDWLNNHRRRIHHQFFSTDMKFFHRSGRVSGATATIASVLGICPIMRLDADGFIVAYDKVRGKNRAMNATVDEMERHAVGGRGYTGRCFVAHSNCLTDALEVRRRIKARFPHIGEVTLYNIGTVIASHCGPGTVAAFFFGDERAPSQKC